VTRKTILQLLCFVVAICAISAWSILFLGKAEGEAAVRPANAIVLAVVMLTRGGWVRRGAVLAWAFGALLVTNLLVGRDPVLSVGFALSNTIEVGVAAWLLRSVELPMIGIRALGAFFLGAAVLAPAVGMLFRQATLSAAGLGPAGAGPIFQWWLAHALGMAVWAPFLLSFDTTVPIRIEPKPFLRGLVAQSLVGLVTLLMFSQNQFPGAYFVFPFVMLAVFASPNFGGVIAIAQISFIALTATALGYGPAIMAAHRGVPLSSGVLVQAFLVVLVATVHPVAAVLKRLNAYAEELDQRRRAAETQSRRKSHILAHVSHEIRTPLSGVVTLTELMKSGAMGELSPRQRDMLGRIAESGAEIETLARDLLDTAAIQSGKAAVKLETVDVATAIEEAIRAASFRTRDHKATVWAGDEGPADLAVAADPQRLRQILVNLIVNAAKYGGRPPVIRVEAVEDGPNAVRFLVSDNGRGVPDARRAELFGSFNRLGAEEGEIEGTGVGLAMSREFAQLQGGELGLDEANSALGGACFWVRLPRQVVAQAA
jgi:signal transduction histidine kinase